MLRSALFLTFALALSACQTAPAEGSPPTAAGAGPVGSAEPGQDKPATSDATKSHGEHTADENGNFPVPFAWEQSRDEPLAMARQFLRDLINDNRIYMARGAPFFAAFKDGQTPRATVVTCSDSRVQTPAFDGSPENDDFMIRNIGNQIVNAEGSVEYGIEHLGTPVLLVLGHTGCGAVKAAVVDPGELSPAVGSEIHTLKLPKAKGALSDAAWSEAVVKNVHAQVAFALQKFGGRVQAAKLTVIGAVYDFRNDMAQGQGKITIVNVNGNEEPQRMRSFVDAVEAQPAAAKPGARPGVKSGLDAASVRIEQALLDTLKEAARLEPTAGKRAEPARIQVTPAGKRPGSTRVEVTPIPP
jgi:carbonic anhydrase